MSTRRNILIGFGALLVGGVALTAQQITRSRPGVAFGTTVKLTVTAATAGEAEAALDSGFAEIAAVHKAASLFDAESEISRLNRSGRLMQPSSIMRDLVVASNQLFALSGGAFDPTVQSLWRAWVETGPAPSHDEIAQALRHVGWHRLSVTARGLALPAGASLTFNGLAQGLAADRVMAAARSKGATSAVIDTGESGLFNHDGALAIQHPRGGRLGTLRLRSGFVAVSGDYASSFTPDFVNHHIFDPRRGHSPRELASAIVVAPTGAMADGLATAFMVMGIEKAISALQELDNTSAIFVTKDGRVRISGDLDFTLS